MFKLRLPRLRVYKPIVTLWPGKWSCCSIVILFLPIITHIDFRQDRRNISSKYQNTKEEYEAIYESWETAKVLKAKDKELQAKEMAKSELEEKIQQQEKQNTQALTEEGDL